MDDGLPPIQTLEELLNEKIEQPADYDPEELTGDDSESDDPETLSLYINRVVRNWNEDDRKKIAYADHVRSLLDKIKDKRELYSALLDYSPNEEEVTIDGMLDFNRASDPGNLLGNRWVCKGSQNGLQGPTGVGKSSLVMQASIRWCLGKTFFGIKPVKPMRILLIQAENDLGDMAEAFQDMTSAMASVNVDPMTKADLNRLQENLIIRRVDSLAGPDFGNYLEQSINLHKPDIVFVDPFLAYVGGDALQQKVMSHFLRTLINPILRKTGAALFWVHHISKPGGNANGQEKSAEQNKYAGLGSSGFQNACREIINLSDSNDGTFKLEFSKRGRRTGIADSDGKPTKSINIKHHHCGIVWERCAGADEKVSKKERKSAKDIDEVRNYIKASKRAVTSEELRVWAPSKDIGTNRVIDIAKVLSSNKSEVIWSYNDPGHKGRGRPGVFFTATKPPSSIKTHSKDREFDEGVSMEDVVDCQDSERESEKREQEEMFEQHLGAK